MATLNRSDLLLLLTSSSIFSAITFALLSLAIPRLLNHTIANAMAQDLARQATIVSKMQPDAFARLDPTTRPLRFWPGPSPPSNSRSDGGPERPLLVQALAEQGFTGPLRCSPLPPFRLYCAYWLLVPRQGQPSLWMFSAPGRTLTWLWPLIRNLSLAIGGAAGISLLLHRRVQQPIADILNVLPAIPTQELQLVPERGIAALQELSVRINRCLSSLNQAHESQRRLLEGLTHDLGSPISRLSMRLESIEAAADPAGQLTQVLPKLRSDINRLSSLTHLLQQSAAQVAPPFHRQDIAIDELCARLAMSYPTDSIQLETPRLIASIDPQLIERALTNLIDNALLHGTPPVRISAQVSRKQLRLRVEDAGCGLVPSQLRMPRIRSAEDRQQSQGVGLGLAIVEHCCQMHGGQLHLERSSLGGLLAELKLPQRQPR